MRRTFGKQELDTAFGSIGQYSHEVSCYIIGGCAMTFRGQKLATKDIDLVFVEKNHLRLLVGAMRTYSCLRPSLTARVT